MDEEWSGGEGWGDSSEPYFVETNRAVEGPAIRSLPRYVVKQRLMERITREGDGKWLTTDRK